jgi:hypothetical protein
MSDNIFLSNRNSCSGRFAIFEDNGIAAWLYLTDPESNKPISDCWLYNRIDAPEPAKVRSFRPGPPPASEEYTDTKAYFPVPKGSDIEFKWSADGNAVALLINKIPVGYILSSEKRGFSRNLIKQGPWGNIFDVELFKTMFPD